MAGAHTATARHGAGTGLRLTAKQMVHDGIREMIVGGDLAPGTRLRQVDFAERFGVSTTPVREAFAELASEGFVDQDAHRGVIVSPARLADLHENYEIRRELEPLATEIACASLTPETVAYLRSTVVQMRRTGDGKRRRALNADFHMTIYAAAGRPRLLEIISTLRDAGDIYLRLLTRKVPTSADYRARAADDHAAICDALERRDSKAAARLMRRHLTRTYEIIESVIDAP